MQTVPWSNVCGRLLAIAGMAVLSAAGLIAQQWPASTENSQQKAGALSAGAPRTAAKAASSRNAVASTQAAQNERLTGDGQRVFIDPRTRRIREPEAEESQALSDLLNQPARPKTFTPITYRDGTVVVDLQGEFMNASIAHLHPDGSIAYQCMDGVQHAEAEVRRGGGKTEKQTQHKEALDVR